MFSIPMLSRRAPVATVLLDVLHSDALEARADGPRGLVAGEEAAAGTDELLGRLLELVRVLREGVQGRASRGPPRGGEAVGRGDAGGEGKGDNLHGWGGKGGGGTGN